MGLSVMRFLLYLGISKDLHENQEMYQNRYIERKIQRKHEERDSLSMRNMREFFGDEKKHGRQNRHTKMQSKINKDIMAPIYAICWIFVGRKHWMAEILRHSQETIWTISEQEMPRIMKYPCNTCLPEIPSRDESFHFLHFQNITPIFLPEDDSREKDNGHEREPESISVFLFWDNVAQQYNQHIPRKNNPREVAPCPIYDDSSNNPQDDIPESLMFTLVDEDGFMKKWQHNEYKSSKVVGIAEISKGSPHIETSLIKWCKWIQSYFLKNGINQDS